MHATISRFAYLIFAICVMVAVGPRVCAQAPPPPTQIRAVQITPIDARTASFVIEFTPARIDAKNVFSTYQITTKPMCKLPEMSGYPPTKTFAQGPYRTTVVCPCNKPYTPYLATVANGARSAVVKGALTAPLPCAK